MELKDILNIAQSGKITGELAYKAISLLIHKNDFNKVLEILYCYYNDHPNHNHDALYQHLKAQYKEVGIYHIPRVYESFNYYSFRLIFDLFSPRGAFLYAYEYGLTRNIYNWILDKHPNILNEIKTTYCNLWVIKVKNTQGLEILIQDGIYTIDEINNIMFTSFTISDIMLNISGQKKIIDLFLRNEWISLNSATRYEYFEDYIRDILEKNNIIQNMNENYNIKHIIRTINEFNNNFNFEIFKILYKHSAHYAKFYVHRNIIHSTPFFWSFSNNVNENINIFLIENLIESKIIYDMIERKEFYKYLILIKEEELSICIEMLLNCGITFTQIFDQFQYFSNTGYQMTVIKCLIDHGANIYEIHEYVLYDNSDDESDQSSEIDSDMELLDLFDDRHYKSNISVINYIRMHNNLMANDIENYFKLTRKIE